MSLLQMQLFPVLNQIDCSSLNIVQSLWNVNIWTAHLNVEWWGGWRRIQQIQLCCGKHQQDPLLLNLILNQTVENTGVKIKRGKEATVSTSQSLVLLTRILTKEKDLNCSWEPICTSLFYKWSFSQQCDISQSSWYFVLLALLKFLFLFYSNRWWSMCKPNNLFQSTAVTIVLLCNTLF